jgi:hypothetical protein
MTSAYRRIQHEPLSVCALGGWPTFAGTTMTVREIRGEYGDKYGDIRIREYGDRRDIPHLNLAPSLTPRQTFPHAVCVWVSL